MYLQRTKSTRFTVTDEKNYKRMGAVHIGKDRKIDRKELIEIERRLNGQCTYWAKMWNSGDNHGHKSRIISSKTTTSENTSDLTLLHKDHKKEPDKTRPVATGNTGNTNGFSNSVSDLLESLANSEPDPYESISSEDMLNKITIYNENVRKRKIIWKLQRTKRFCCKLCQIIKAVEECEECKHAMTVTGDDLKLSSCLEESIQRECCRRKIWTRMEQDCEECGRGIHEEDQQMCLVGNDVVALFPSILSRSTGIIVRNRAEKNPLEFKGFNYKQGARYIKMHEHLTCNLHEIKDILPKRAKKKGVAPGVTGEGVMNKDEEDEDMEHQWTFPKKEPTDMQKRQIIARVAEIGVRIIL